MSILNKIQDFFKEKKELEADKLPQKIYNSLVYTFYYNSPGWENMRKFFENVLAQGGASTENRFPDSPEWWVPTKNHPPSSG